MSKKLTEVITTRLTFSDQSGIKVSVFAPDVKERSDIATKIYYRELYSILDRISKLNQKNSVQKP